MITARATLDSRTRTVLFDAEAWPPSRAEIVSALALLLRVPRRALDRSTVLWFEAAPTIASARSIVAHCSVGNAAAIRVVVQPASPAST